MKIEISKKDDMYSLTIDGEEIMKTPFLSECVDKIEAYLKLRYLKEQDYQKKGIFGMFGGNK